MSEPYNGGDQLRPVVTHKADGVEDVHLSVDLQLVPADVYGAENPTAAGAVPAHTDACTTVPGWRQ